MKHFPRRTVAPTVEPLTVEQLKAHLRVDDEESDYYLSSLITVVREQAEDRTERTLMPSTWTLRLPAFPSTDGGSIELLRPPVMAITSVQYLDVNAIQRTVDPSTYLVDTANELGVLMPLARSWPATAEHPHAVTIVYTAGYANAEAVPAPIKQWMLLAAGDLYEMRQRSSDKPALEQGFADSLLTPYLLLGV